MTKLPRRKFIKRGLLYVAAPMIFIPRLRANRVVNRAAPGGGSCPDDGSPSVEQDGGAGENSIGRFTNRWYFGQKNWSDASSRQICKLGFKVVSKNGTVTGITYRAEIFTLSGSSLNASLGTSNGLDGGSLLTGANWNIFEFASPISVSASTNFGLTVRRDGSVDASNYIVMRETEAVGTLAGTRSVWADDKTEDVSSATLECNLRIYFA